MLKETVIERDEVVVCVEEGDRLGLTVTDTDFTVLEEPDGDSEFVVETDKSGVVDGEKDEEREEEVEGEDVALLETTAEADRDAETVGDVETDLLCDAVELSVADTLREIVLVIDAVVRLVGEVVLLADRLTQDDADEVINGDGEWEGVLDVVAEKTKAPAAVRQLPISRTTLLLASATTTTW